MERGECGPFQRLDAARSGDRQALDELLEEVRPGLLRYLSRRLPERAIQLEVAEDLTQETLLRIAGGIARCRARTPAQFRAWYLTIARRVAIDWWRKESERRSEPLDAGAVSLGSPTITGRTGPLQRVLGRLLYEAQGALSPGTRRVIAGRVLHGETWREVAAAVNTTPGGARSRYRRALKRLDREIRIRAHRLSAGALRTKLLRWLEEGE